MANMLIHLEIKKLSIIEFSWKGKNWASLEDGVDGTYFPLFIWLTTYLFGFCCWIAGFVEVLPFRRILLHLVSRAKYACIGRKKITCGDFKNNQNIKKQESQICILKKLN
jgi:hypothetical protein